MLASNGHKNKITVIKRLFCHKERERERERWSEGRREGGTEGGWVEPEEGGGGLPSPPPGKLPPVPGAIVINRFY